MRRCIVAILCSWLGLTQLSAQNTNYRDYTVDEIQQDLAIGAIRFQTNASILIRRVGEIRAAKESGCAELSVYSTVRHRGVLYFIYIDWSLCQVEKDNKGENYEKD